MEKELIGLQYSLPVGLNDNSSEELAKLQEQLNLLDNQLERYINQADRLDYAVAVASGILCGIVDSFFIGKLTITKADISLSHEQVNHFIEEYAEKRGFESKNPKPKLKSKIAFLEDKFKVAQDNVWKGQDIGVGAKNHHLADLAHHPTPLGLVSAILVQFLRIGVFVNKDGEWHIERVDTAGKDLAKIWIPAVVTGVTDWLIAMAEEHQSEGENLPEYVRKLIKLLANAPLAIEVLKCADNWFGHLVSDMGGSKQTAGAGMGIPGIFLSLLYEISSMPGLNQTGMPKYINDLYVKEKLNLRRELPLMKNLSKQSIPVLLNEILVRSFYFARHLAEECREHTSLREVDWKRVCPVGNRTVERMTTIANLTFTAADTADAALRSALESGGNAAIFLGGFASRLNLVGAATATISVCKEISADQKELQLLREKRILTEAKTEKAVEMIRDYREQLEKLIDQYLAEDLQTYITGTSDMETAMIKNDTEGFIRGNLRIQRIMGREIQFSNQSEFDTLMASDEAFKL